MNCCLCGTYTHYPYPLCGLCSDKIERLRTGASCCPVCGQTLWNDLNVCPECRGIDSPLESFKGLYRYKGLMKRLVQLYKFEELFSLSRYFAAKLYTALQEGYREYTIQIIPPRRGKLYRRGWDQMHWISSCLPWPRIDLLSRKNGITQKHLNKEDRSRNIMGQFMCKKNRHPTQPVLLLDDVHTTGSTLKEAARVMREKGACKVAALTLAVD